MTRIFVTRRIPEVGLSMLREQGFEVDINPENRILSKAELVSALSAKPYDGVLSLLTDTIDAEVLQALPSVKIFANYAVGFNNIDVAEATKRGVVVTNTPGALSETVAEHAMALMLAVSKRIVEAHNFTASGKYVGWDPLLFIGSDLEGETFGLLGLGRIGQRAAHIASRGFGMKLCYYDVQRNEAFEKEYGAVFYPTPEEMLPHADVVSLHVPLLPTTTHLMNAQRFALMKKTSIVINTSRGPVVDEKALVEALQQGTIAGAGLDVFEREPAIEEALKSMGNVVMTPHIASATRRARDEMATLAATNLIDFFAGKEPKNKVVV